MAPDATVVDVLPDVTQNRSCHEKCRAARIYVTVRDGTHNPKNWTLDVKCGSLLVCWHLAENPHAA